MIIQVKNFRFRETFSRPYFPFNITMTYKIIKAVRTVGKDHVHRPQSEDKVPKIKNRINTAVLYTGTELFPWGSPLHFLRSLIL